MIRVLHIVPNMQFGGIETFIMNIYREIDKSKIQFDFLVHYEQEFHYDKEIEKLGGKIYHLSFRNDNNIIKYIKDLKTFFNLHSEYKIIHGHMMSTAFIYMKIAKQHGVPIRISHCHDASYLRNYKGYIKNFLYKFAPTNSNVHFACSDLAGKYLYKNKKFEVIHNVIDLKKYRFNDSYRTSIREELKIKEKDILIGHIGRFNLQKNHKFIINVFEKIYSKSKNYKLLLIGDGELKDDILKMVDSKDLKENVIFIDKTDFPEKYYCAMDLFILPSFFEGLPLVGIEAQATNLHCIFSNNITKEVDFNNCVFLELDEKKWCDYILNFSYYGERDYINKNIEKNGYSSKSGSFLLQNKYIEYYNNCIGNNYENKS